MDVSKYRALFIEESREHLAEMSRLLVELETASTRGPLIDEVFRHAHSIKSMAATMGYEPIATLAHRLEDVVGAHRGSGSAFPATTVDSLLRGVDALSAQVQSIAEGKPLDGHFDLVRELAQAVQAETRQAPGTVTKAEVDIDVTALPPTVCVRLVQGCAAPALRAFLIYRRLSELGEIVQTQPRLEEIKSGQMSGREVRLYFRHPYDPGMLKGVLAHVPDIDNVTFEEVGSGATLAAAAGLELGRADSGVEFSKSMATVRVRTDLLDDIMDSVGELFIVRERLRLLLVEDGRQPVKSAVDGLGRRIRQIHDQVIAARMMPVRTLTDRYPRLVRDLCRTLGKDIDLEVRGRDIEIDRAILDNLDVPFIHTLRNAVDHGIEPPTERMGRGKPAAGRVIITATRDRDTVLVIIEDDGRGLDTNKLREVAVKRGLVTAEQARELTAREAYFLVCLPGFSTKTEVSDISGRGVGMDVVAGRLEAVGGSLDIESELGRGTRFIFRLPQTLAIIPVLLVQTHERTFAVPVAKVVAVRETADDTLLQPDGSRYISFRHGLLRIYPLATLLGLTRTPLPHHVVVVESGRELYALGVDGIVGYHEVVVKPLGDPLDRLELFSGATILGDGQPILILDLPKTLRMRSAA